MREPGEATTGPLCFKQRTPIAAIRGFVFIALGCLFIALPPAAATDQADYGDEPYLYERVRSEITYQADGTGRAITLARVRLINESGVQQMGQILFPYTASQETLSIEFARIHKPDGTVVEVATDALVDQPAPFAAFFPFYSDVRLLHLLAPSLRPGDILDYQAVREIHNPPAPGNFFFEHDFDKDVVTLDESVILRFPADMEVQLRYKHELTFLDSTNSGTRTLEWKTSDLPPMTPQDTIDLSELVSIPDIEVSSFESWVAVGNWYRELAKDRDASDEAISGKALSLIDGLDEDLDKIRAIYNFVTREFRHLGLELGIGAYQPSLASEVFANRYGDCKDKHTLLQSLLQVAGFEASPVLVSALRRLSPEVPSPGQFDHVITAVAIQGGNLLYLDSTMQVSPFGYLGGNIRGKTGLLIPTKGEAELVELAGEVPFETSIEVQVTAEIDDEANLESQVVQRYRGDREVMLRTMLFNLPTGKWPELAEGAHDYLANFGEIEDPKFSGATETDEPLSLTYTLTKDEYIDSNDAEQDLLPLLPRSLPPAVPENKGGAEAEPLEIDQPKRLTSRLVMRLTPRFEAESLEPTVLEETFGEYRSSYRVEGDQLTAERSLVFLESEIDPEAFTRYRAFREAIEKDQKKTFTLRLSAQALEDQVARGDLEALYSRAEQAVDDKAWQGALPLLQQVVELDPDHPSAWQDLGRALGNTGDYEAGIEAIRKQLEINPDHDRARNNLGWALWEVGDLEGAEAAFRAQLERFPHNRYATSNLAKLLTEQDRCADAIPLLQQSVTLDRNHNWNRYRLGRCLLIEGRGDEGVERLEELVEATENTNLLLRAGQAADEYEQFDAAIALYEQIVFLDPENPDGYLSLGLSLSRSGRPAEAIQVLRKYLELAPDDNEMRQYVSALMSMQGDFTQAEAVATTDEETDSWALSVLILSLHQDGKTGEAIEKAEVYLENHPEDLEVLDALGAVQLSAKHLAEAQETYRRIVAIDPEYPMAQHWLARTYMDSMQFEKARPHVDEALNQDSSFWETNRMMGFLHALDGDLDTAIQYLETAQSTAPKPFDAQIREQIEALKSKRQ